MSDDTLSALLASTCLEHLEQCLASQGVSGLLLRCEDRVNLLQHLKVLGVARLAERQLLANALGKLKRQFPSTSRNANPADGAHPVLRRPELIERHGLHCGAVGILFHTDGSCSHVNEAPYEHEYGFTHYSTGLQQPKLDGPIVSEVARLAPLVGRPVFYACCDEDPFVREPASSYRREAALLDDTKLADFRAALGDDVAVLTTTAVRGLTSVPRSVGLLPAFDSWARLDEAAAPWMRALRQRPMRAELPFAARQQRAVWRGAATGGEPGTSLRGRVVEACHGRTWADVNFVNGAHTGGMGGAEAGGLRAARELSREEQAAYQVLILVDGHTWPSAWE